jgi:hypothetical protein
LNNNKKAMNMPFVKGKSGNPAGRKAGSKNRSKKHILVNQLDLNRAIKKQRLEFHAELQKIMNETREPQFQHMNSPTVSDINSSNPNPNYHAGDNR